jgi:methylated-DNA-protein-cysteine methyltransferase-like protein
MALSENEADERERQLYAWMAQIPRGRVVTYGQLAKLIGLPNGARWVGRQMGRLPHDSGLPWFRVINAQGRSSIPVDASGWNRQLRLLQREGVEVVGGRISLRRFRWDPFGSAGPSAEGLGPRHRGSVP